MDSPPMLRPCCMSSLYRVSQPASIAVATIRASQKGKRMVARKRKRRSVRVGSEMTPPPAIVVSARSRRMSAEKA
ncbi:hypothetical protein ABIB80_001119 [Bradyrhizobium sp. i1.15.2]